jgi:uncharacterized protein RhaS with RHS repeats
VRARWYDPFLGRFLSEDPIGLEGGINQYTYALNDPVNLRDPTGMIPCTAYWIVMAGWSTMPCWWYPTAAMRTISSSSRFPD